METYDPLLHARKEALLDLQEDLTDEEYDIAEKAIELFLDKMDYELEHAKSKRFDDTGHLIITAQHESTTPTIIQANETCDTTDDTWV